MLQSLRPHVDFPVGEDQARVPFGDAFAAGEIALFAGDVEGRPEEGSCTIAWVIAEDAEIFAAASPVTGESDIDSDRIIHAHTIPALLQRHIGRRQVIKFNFGPAYFVGARLEHLSPRRCGEC